MHRDVLFVLSSLIEIVYTPFGYGNIEIYLPLPTANTDKKAEEKKVGVVQGIEESELKKAENNENDKKLKDDKKEVDPKIEELKIAKGNSNCTELQLVQLKNGALVSLQVLIFLYSRKHSLNQKLH